MSSKQSLPNFIDIKNIKEGFLSFILTMGDKRVICIMNICVGAICFFHRENGIRQHDRHDFDCNSFFGVAELKQTFHTFRASKSVDPKT